MNPDRLNEGCALPKEFLEPIQHGTMQYRYKGVPTLKNPFDLALYQMLLWQLKPRTLIEIGSKYGGSALWFSDQLRTFGVDFEIHSVDVNPVTSFTIPHVHFRQGDGRNLSAVFPSEMMAAIPRPLLVIDDADHRPATTLAILRFFDEWLTPDEYICIEDTIVDDLFDEARMRALEGGPRPAIAQFLSERGDDYEIDTSLCDFFGRNVTWNVNGFLRRKR